MAADSESEVEEDVFLGFDEEEREVVAAWREARFEARNLRTLSPIFLSLLFLMKTYQTSRRRRNVERKPR